MADYNQARRSPTLHTFVYRFRLRHGVHQTIRRVFETEIELDTLQYANDALTTARYLVEYFRTEDPDPEEHAEAEALVAYLIPWEEADYKAGTLARLGRLEERRKALEALIAQVRREIDGWL